MGRTYSRQCSQCSQVVTCPETPLYPFCSERCRLLDLGAWASGDYRLPGEPLADPQDVPGMPAPESEEEVDWHENWGI